MLGVLGISNFFHLTKLMVFSGAANLQLVMVAFD